MTIRPVDFNGMMQQQQDVGTQKAHQDNHPITEQQNLAVTFDKKLEHETHRIGQPNQSSKEDEKFDARDEGKNKFFNQRRQQDKKEKQGSVREKDKPAGGFDIRI